MYLVTFIWNSISTVNLCKNGSIWFNNIYKTDRNSRVFSHFYEVTYCKVILSEPWAISNCRASAFKRLGLINLYETFFTLSILSVHPQNIVIYYTPVIFNAKTAMHI